jgi:hypothetical protein
MIAGGGDITFSTDPGQEGAGLAMLALDMDSTAGQVAVVSKVDGDDLAFKQFDGTEVARVIDGTATAAVNMDGSAVDSDLIGISPGFGSRRPIAKIGGASDVSATLTKSMSGYIILVDADTAYVTLSLPACAAAADAGITFRIVALTTVGGSKSITIYTNAGSAETSDEIYGMIHTVGADSSFSTDIAGNTLTLVANTTAGSYADITCIQGGGSEIWHAEVFASHTATVTDQ